MAELHERVGYWDLTPEERAAIQEWLAAHRIDPNRTPIDPLLEYDDVHDEWRIEQYKHDERGRLLVDETGDGVRRCIVRRRSQSWVSWPYWGGEVR